MSARRVSLQERREQRRTKRPRTRDVPHPFLLPLLTVEPERKDAG